MYIGSVIFSLVTFAFMAVSSPANSADLSRQWEHHFWIHDYTDLNLRVFHLPNGTIRASGRFSNGLKTAIRTISVIVLVENDMGEIWHMKIIERVPSTGFGGTQVRYKEQDMVISGNVSKVRAVASIIDSGESFSIEIECEDGGTPETGCKLDWSSDYENNPDRLIGSSHTLIEGEKVNICAGFQSNTWVNYPAQTGHWTECDPKSGIISKQSKALEHKIYPCRGCQIH